MNGSSSPSSSDSFLIALFIAFMGLKAKFSTTLVATTSTVPIHPGVTVILPILPSDRSKGKLPSSSSSSWMRFSLSFKSLSFNGKLKALALSKPSTKSPKVDSNIPRKAASMIANASQKKGVN